MDGQLSANLFKLFLNGLATEDGKRYNDNDILL